jgi:hypothetical protein
MKDFLNDLTTYVSNNKQLTAVIVASMTLSNAHSFYQGYRCGRIAETIQTPVNTPA